MDKGGTDAERAAFPFWVLFASLGLALIGDFLLRGTPWGVNVPIFVFLCGLCAAGLLRKSPVTISRAALWMLLPIGAFSLCFFWRDSDDLKIANLTAVVMALGVLALRARSGRLAVAGIVEYTFSLVAAWFSFTSHFAHLVTKDLKLTKDSVSGARLVAFVRGLMLASPLLLVFGLLFANGDAAFADDLAKMFSFDIGDLVLDILVFVALVLFVGGLFRRLLLHVETPPVLAPETKPLAVGTIELATVFGLLDVLFVMFVASQFRHFFGGASQVASVVGLTYAEYARSGFFELSIAAALTLPVILGAHALVPQTSKNAPKVFAVLSTVLVLCVLVVLASAWGRMRLYVGAYGLSELRVFTTAFMAWLAVAMVWLAATVVRNRRDRFAFGALAAGYAVILGLNCANPDALIARVNMDPRKSVDVSTISSLSLDAAPTIANRIGYLRPDAQQAMRNSLSRRWNSEVESADWRSMNLSRIRWESYYKKLLYRAKT